MRLDKSQTQHLQREVQRETAAMSHNYSTTQEANYSTAQEAVLNEGIQETDELLHYQEASDIWNRTKKLGVTEGEHLHPVIDRLKEMEDRDKKEVERLGNSSGYP